MKAIFTANDVEEDVRITKSSSQTLIVADKEDEVYDTLFQHTGIRNRREFISFYSKKDSLGLFQPSLPRFPKVGPFIRTDIPDPSKKNISFKSLSNRFDEALVGYSMSNSKIKCIGGDKIMFREDYNLLTQRVRLISSGVGMWGDYVGKGMLTCMVMGTYGSPKPRVIYIAMRELDKTADKGVLAIIPNNYDEKLNWGIALARAYRKGLKIDCVTFGDNAYEKCKVDERSCLPGIVIYYKLAGAMSEEKFTLPVMLDRLNMMFFATISCHFGKTVRVGTDLEGEGGYEVKRPRRSRVIESMLSRLVDRRRKYSVGYDPGVEFVVLINTYVANWTLAQVVTMDVLKKITVRKFRCIRVYAGHLVPSVSQGFSITILPEGDLDIIRWLDSFTTCQGWLVAGTGCIGKFSVSSLPGLPRKGVRFRNEQSSTIRKVLALAASNFKSSEEYLNFNDPDHIYGTNMCKIMDSILQYLESSTEIIEFPFILFNTFAKLFEEVFNNIDGVMFGLFATTMGQYFGEHLKSSRHITSKIWERALQRSVKSVAGYFKVGYKDNTILDVFGSLYMIMAASHMDVLTDLHLALEVSDQQCWKAKYSKSRNIINSPYATMKTAYIMLESIGTVMREISVTDRKITARDIDTTPNLYTEKLKDLLISG